MVQFMLCLLDKNENYIDNCMYVVKSLMVTSNHKEKKRLQFKFLFECIFYWLTIVVVIRATVSGTLIIDVHDRARFQCLFAFHFCVAFFILCQFKCERPLRVACAMHGAPSTDLFLFLLVQFLCFFLHWSILCVYTFDTRFHFYFHFNYVVYTCLIVKTKTKKNDRQQIPIASVLLVLK